MQPVTQLSLKFKKLTEHAFKPVKGSPLAAGFDLQSAYDYIVEPQEKALVKTDIAIKVPEGCYGRIAPRSGLAVKKFIDVGAGVVDRDYRGNVGVVLFNFGKEPFEIKKGDRIAQLILEKVLELNECEEVENLDETERGSDGFGSTTDGVGLPEMHADVKSMDVVDEPNQKKLKSNEPVIEIEA